METVALRQFDPLYIIFDILFLILLAGLLIWKKRYSALLVGGLAGILYMIVDYGIFNLVCGARSISGGYSLFWVLLWMSMSYGFTNFVWIWLWISKDKHLLEWSFLILLWWFCCPLLTQTFGGFWEPVVIQRTTGSYHGYMALLLFAGYLFVIIWNMSHRDREEQMPLLWLLAIGILVQLGWEAGLLLGGVRSAGFDFLEAMRTLVINSLLETNLGMPYIYCIFLWFSSRYTHTLRHRESPVSFLEALRENNAMKLRRERSAEGQAL
ncbi:MAG: hypothetical protein ACOX68_06110 [Candidatus Limivicinus sp.]|jgi:hypothetical protein